MLILHKITTTREPSYLFNKLSYININIILFYHNIVVSYIQVYKSSSMLDGRHLIKACIFT